MKSMVTDIQKITKKGLVFHFLQEKDQLKERTHIFHADNIEKSVFSTLKAYTSLVSINC